MVGCGKCLIGRYVVAMFDSRLHLQLEWRDKKEKTSIIDENGQKKFTCDLCPRTYDTMHMLRRHETRHKFYKGVVCDLCGLYVCSPAALRKHKSFKHSNNRPYTCDKCDGAFKSKWGLHEHMRTLHSVSSFILDSTSALQPFIGRCRRNATTHVHNAVECLKAILVCTLTAKWYTRPNGGIIASFVTKSSKRATF
jgi:Zinc finger, C2H2 type